MGDLTQLPQAIQAGTELITDAKNIKVGWKTTEFWFSVAASVGALAAFLGGVLPGKAAAALVAISTSAYSISRGLAKK